MINFKMGIVPTFLNCVRVIRERFLLNVFLSFFTIFGCTQTCFSFETKAKYAILADYDTGQILYEKDAYEMMHPSSMTKMMTAYVIFDHLENGTISLEDKVKVSKKARYMEGSRMFLEQGSRVRLEEMLKGLLVQSGNDAAVALAEYVIGSEEEFVNVMNEYAQKLEMNDTLFVNCCGLTNEKHLTTMYDLYLLSRALIRDFPKHYYLFSIKEFEHNNIKQPNWNKALGSRGIDGIKTGHTNAGGHGVALSAVLDGRRLVAVINGMEHYKPRDQEAVRIIEHGFDDFEYKEVVNAGLDNTVSHIKVRYGKNPNVDLIAKDSISMYIDKTKENSIKMEIVHDDVVTAPVSKGEVLGYLNVLDENDDIVEQTYLVAACNVSKAGPVRRFLQNMKHIAGR